VTGAEPLRRDVRVAIIGSGFAGLGMAIRLKQEGIDDFVVLERAGDVGGTWRDNTYPGCACDVPSRLYSYSFAPNPDWSRSFSPQGEIEDYLRRCAETYGIIPHIRFREEMLSAKWNEDHNLWSIATSHGRLNAAILVSGMGALSEPSIPMIPGLGSFRGRAFHSARWDHDHDLNGRKVAVIGTGASAIQFIPQIQPLVEQLHVFQRTPPWIFPRMDRLLSRPERWLFHSVPAAQRFARAGVYWTRESYMLGYSGRTAIITLAELLARLYMRGRVPDRELRTKVTPGYTIGCKRVLISNDYYPAIKQPNVHLHTVPIREVLASSIACQDGTEWEIDTIIFGTGFRVTTEWPAAQRVWGRDGVLLRDAWRDRMEAYFGTTVAGFPNLFLLVGPNTFLGHSSVILMIESQIAYVIDCLRQMEKGGISAVDVREDAQVAFNEHIQSKFAGSVWASGCASWYLDASGDNRTLWPDFTWRFRKLTRRFDAANYQVTRRETMASHLASPPESMP
jgi:cation diffusion facilitator CzcD-associated flavoprotein CzcO